MMLIVLIIILITLMILMILVILFLQCVFELYNVCGLQIKRKVIGNFVTRSGSNIYLMILHANPAVSEVATGGLELRLQFADLGVFFRQCSLHCQHRLLRCLVLFVSDKVLHVPGENSCSV
jgi:hypothetical protein